MTRYEGKVLPDGRTVLVPVGAPRREGFNTLPRHIGERGEVTEGCPCVECAAAGMAPAPPVDLSATLRQQAKEDLDKLRKRAEDAVAECKAAMTATILRRRSDGAYKSWRFKHNERSLKLKRVATRAFAAYKRAEDMYHAMS